MFHQMSYVIKSFLIILIFLFLLEYFFIKNYFCISCIKNISYSSKCFQCPIKMLFNGLQIASDEETLNQIINNNKSISRFGDGEFLIIFGESLVFQKSNTILSNRLKEILNNTDNKFLVGINVPYKDFYKLNDYEKKYWTRYFNKFKFELIKILNKKKKYYSASISRFYFRYKDKSKVPNYVKKLKKIWENKDLLIIEGNCLRIGIGNDLFINAKSIKRIICPSINAFEVYDKIIKSVLKLKEKRLILIALGPAASILSYDLYKLGYQTIDFGHLDIEYEWFLRNTVKKIQIENKYVSEANGSSYNFSKVKDKNYYKQIISQIIN